MDFNKIEMKQIGEAFSNLDAFLYNAEKNKDLDKILLIKPVVEVLNSILVVEHLKQVEVEIKERGLDL